MVWLPYQISCISRLNKVENNFFKTSTSRGGVNSFDFKSSTAKRVEFDVTFIYKIQSVLLTFLFQNFISNSSILLLQKFSNF